jgi:hypothetical protein
MTAAADRRPSILGWTGWLGMTLLAVVIAVPAYRYLAHTGRMPANIAANRHVSPWLVIHATACATGLLLGPFQFLRACTAGLAAATSPPASSAAPPA